MAEIATREAYGKKLAELGGRYPNIIVLDADLSGSTKTAVFAGKYPNRFFNMGVAEQDMMGTAAGLATCGKIVFASTFAIFAAGRAWEPIRQSICYPNLPVKICASHAGLSVGEDGASHQMIEDIAIMRAIPHMKVFVPSDGIETEQILEAVVKDPGPCYVRLSRAKSPMIFDASYQFAIGRGNIVREGRDVCVFTAGLVTPAVLGAAEILKAQGINPTIVNMASVKPIDRDLVAAMAQRHKLLVSVEEHTVIGGLGSAIAETLAEVQPARLMRLGVNDEFGTSGEAMAVMAHYGLSAEGIAQSILQGVKN